MKECQPHGPWVPMLFAGGPPVTAGDGAEVEFSLCLRCGALRIVCYYGTMTSTSIYWRDQPNTI